MKKNTRILSPQIPELESAAFQPEDEALFENLKFSDADQSRSTVTNLIIRESCLEKVTMTNSRLERFETANVIFEKCDFSNSELPGASLHQTEFRQCRLIGTNFAESWLRDVHFTDCLLDYASFANTNLKSVAFTNCRLRSAEFYDISWQNLQLLENDLHDTNWLRTKLGGLTFIGNRFDKLGLSADQLKGLTVDPAQALILAAGLGLIIE